MGFLSHRSSLNKTARRQRQRRECSADVVPLNSHGRCQPFTPVVLRPKRWRSPTTRQQTAALPTVAVLRDFDLAYVAKSEHILVHCQRHQPAAAVRWYEARCLVSRWAKGSAG